MSKFRRGWRRRKWSHRKWRQHRWHHRKWHPFRDTLAEACPGVQVRIVDLDGVTGPRRLKLLALGLWPGRCVEVIRHSPVTLVRAEHSELALEAETARGIKVAVDATEDPSAEGPCEDSDSE